MDSKQGTPYDYRRNAARKFVLRVLFFGLICTAFHFLYILYDGSSCTRAGSKCLNGQIYQDFVHLSSALQPLIQSSSYKIQAFQESSELHLRKGLTSNLKRLWTSREWRKKVTSFSLLFTELMEAGILHAGDKGLCIAAGAGHEVLALQEIGVNSFGIDIVSSSPLVIEGDMHRIPFSENVFDFEFSNSVDMALFSETVGLEIERTLKPGGFAIIHVSEETLTRRFGVDFMYSVNKFTELFKYSDVVHVKKVHTSDIDYEIVLKKRLLSQSIGDFSQADKCIVHVERKMMVKEAEPLILEEPLKPWITLKENAQKIRYLTSLTDISDNHQYVYVDVGARSYRSSIGSWFVKRYPKQNQDFTIYAIEADSSFASDYAKRKNVNFLPYAAWIRNETLMFGANPENRAVEGEIGMGRIQSRSSLEGDNVPGKQFKKVQGFDFADWLISTVTADDFVVMKMDVEGTEFDLLPRMIETGAICLVDELFLECHYNRWQRSSPFRTAKYGKTYRECRSLFQILRRNGVLVHQWW
ncbi:hypothetical protein L7F22_025780 [Adiantum nelumboides]|nr:hypothetical protein [Adiantum nelumboides]